MQFLQSNKGVNMYDVIKVKCPECELEQYINILEGQFQFCCKCSQGLDLTKVQQESIKTDLHTVTGGKV